MTRVITYGTYDLMHYGHIRLLERAKALGDYLIVGVTSDDFDKTRGKINVQQPLMERIEGVRQLGIADEIIVEEYEGQKIDDIKRYDVDIFTVGSDWVGKFDYLGEFCKVIYLERTEGVSSSDIRSKDRAIRLGLIGGGNVMMKYKNESKYVNGVELSGVCSSDEVVLSSAHEDGLYISDSLDDLLDRSDAVYIITHPAEHGEHVRRALSRGKHVLCESPVAISASECAELFALARSRGLVLMDAIKTAYSTAYNRLLLLLKGGRIGRIMSVDVTCTSLEDLSARRVAAAGGFSRLWNSICAWGPTAMLPIFQILGTEYSDRHMTSCVIDEATRFDIFTKIDFTYPGAVASLKIGNGVKSEGEMIISGTKGYVYVPAPWWKTDYYELRFEDPTENRRMFYQLDGEGIRYEIVAFIKSISTQRESSYISEDVSITISKLIEAHSSDTDIQFLSNIR